jgi:thioredoxin-like negative regulator of GroEL
VGNDFVLVAVNTDQRPDIMQKYGVTGLPTIVFLNSKGEVIHKFVGYQDYAGVMRDVEIARSKLK